MDVGAAFCRKREPRCDACPLAARCRYLAAGRPPERLEGARPPAQPFSSTNRWLRGRILDRLRDAADPGWVSFNCPIGDHAVDAVLDALAALSREQLLELDSSGQRARLTPSG